MRRKALFETAEILGANKVALGHHRDDVIETFFLNMMFSRELSTIVPNQELFQGKYRIIRPMFLIDKIYINAYCQKMHIPYVKSVCPMDKTSKREFVRLFCEHLYRQEPKAKKNIFRALFKPKNDYLLAQYSDLLSQI